MAIDSPQSKPATLRTLRHVASKSPSSSSSSTKTLSRASQLSVKQRIALRAAKPLIQGRQFKWISPAVKLQQMDVDMERVRSRRDMLEGENEDVDESHSLFGNALMGMAQLNLSLPFIKFSRSVQEKSRSLPLVIYHMESIVRSICEALRGSKLEVELCGEGILE